MDLSDWINCRADITPEKPAMVFEGGQLSYTQMARRIDISAQILAAELGVRHGDRVAYLGLNSPEFIILLFACARVGAVLLPLNWRLAAAEHAQLMQHARPVVLFAEQEFTGHIDTVRQQFESVALVALSGAGEAWQAFETLENNSERKPPFTRPNDLSEDDGLVLCYTSGTTGIPKGALLSKNALFWKNIFSIQCSKIIECSKDN